MGPLPPQEKEKLSQPVDEQEQRKPQVEPQAAAVDAASCSSGAVRSSNGTAGATMLSPAVRIDGTAPDGAETEVRGGAQKQVTIPRIPEGVPAAEGDKESTRPYEGRRKLLQEKSKQLHWGTSLQVYTPVHVWINTYKLKPAALGPGFEAGKMVNNRGLVISTYKWTHPDPAEVRGAIILYHSYTSHALWDFLRHQPLQQQEQSLPGYDKQQRRDGDGNTYPARAVARETGALGSLPAEEDIRQWVPQYSGSWVEALYTEGFNVYAADHQSHGHSEGWRGWRCNVQDFFCFVEDSLQFLCEVVARDPRTPVAAPIYLLGYSMGGNIALQTVGALFDPLTAAAYHTVAAEAASLVAKCPPHPDVTAVATSPVAAAAASRPSAHVAPPVAPDSAASPAPCLAAAGTVQGTRAPPEHQQPPPLVRERVKAVVLLAPLIKILVDRKTKVLAKINVHLLSCCLPNLRLVRSAGGPDYEYLDWWYEKDLFAYAGRSKSRMVANLFRAAQRVKRSIKRLPPHLKVLCLQGTRDMTVDYRGPLALTQSHAKVDLIYLTGWSHYLAKERGSELLTDLVVAWLRAKLHTDFASVPNDEDGGRRRCDENSSGGSKQPPVLFDFPKYTKLQASHYAT